MALYIMGAFSSFDNYVMQERLIPGHLPIPARFTTVGKPHIFVNQYDSPIECYSEETIEEMKEERLTMLNPDHVDRVAKKGKPQKQQPLPGGLMGASADAKFDGNKSNVLGMIAAGSSSSSRGK